MNIFRRTILVLNALFLTGGTAFCQQHYILNTADGPSLFRVVSQYGLGLDRMMDSPANAAVVSVQNPSSKLVAAVASDPSVLSFEADQEARSPETPVAVAAALDPLAPGARNSSSQMYFGSRVRQSYVDQKAAQLIELGTAQRQFTTGAGIVAIIDTGVDPAHPALANVLLPGYDFTRNQPGGSELADLSAAQLDRLKQSTVAILDGNGLPVSLSQSTVAILDQSTVAILDGVQVPSHFGHGTMVAGLIHLVAPTATILPLKAFHSDGTAALSDIVRAIYFAVGNGANVINMSFSLTTPSVVLQGALQYAASHGVILVAAGGNDGRAETVYPAALQGVIGVASTNATDHRSTFSNYGDASIRMAAPGEALVTSYPGNHWAGVWGTSFSAALVSGAASLLTQYGISAVPAALDAFGNGKQLGDSGLGESRLDVLLSLQSVAQPPSAPAGDN